MQAPDKPADENRRIETLRSYNILDTSPEERFDRLTRLAKRLFNVPIALVSLVDINRQWFKSRQGIQASETSRDISFCGHAILGDDILLVSDTLADARFHDNPLVTDEPGIRFYAGCPLVVPNGSRLGTLCLIDVKPRDLNDDDRQLLRDLARMAEQEIAAVQMATMDELTQLSNRRGFELLAQHALNVCRRMQMPASLLFFDLNNFKQINDRYGHAEGDRALSAFAELLRITLRESDTVGRIGGDEFVALLTDSDHDTTNQAIRRLQQALDIRNREQRRGYDISFSVGQIAYHPERHTTVAELFHEADTAMYSHKQTQKGDTNRR